MNPYLKNVNKLEFVVTNACTGSCKHCSQGEHKGKGTSLSPALCERVVDDACRLFPLETVMVFGGEPLLAIDAVESILTAAKKHGVSRRQLITNGFVTEDKEKIDALCQRLAACGVNDLLLSVDAFHQETIPLEIVFSFAESAKGNGIPTRLQPAWLVSIDDQNPYNEKTRAVLSAFSSLGIPVGEGNVVFPEGNALLHLGDYFLKNAPINPYEEDPKNRRTLSVSADGELLGGNLNQKSLSCIVNEYRP